MSGGQLRQTVKERPTRSSKRARAPQVGPAFELLESKLRPPVSRRTAVRRSELVQRLLSSQASPVVTVSAGPGYGKTTLIVQWADADERPIAWVSLDERDNDPVTFLTYVAAALDRIEPIPPGVFEALSSPGAGPEAVLVPRLASALLSRTVPLVLVLDDLHAVGDRVCLDAIATLVSHLPAGSQVALIGRGDPDLPLSRLRAQGDAFDLGAADLAFDAQEADVLLRDHGLHLPEGEVADLVKRFEGWPIGLYLSVLSSKAGGDRSAAAVSGDDAVVAEYLRSELLDRQRPETALFLTRTSVLDEMSGSLCDAVLEQTGSAETLETISHQNLLVAPIDRRHEWFRYHRLFRDLLRFDLQRREPNAAEELGRRAARWCEENGRPDTAIEYAQAAGDADRAARLFGSLALPRWSEGRVATVKRWVDWFDQAEAIDRYPTVALLSALVFVNSGDAEHAVRFAAAGDGVVRGEMLADGVTPAQALAAVLRAGLCREGVERMGLDARRAVDQTPESSRLRGLALVISGIASLMAGDDQTADSDFARAAEVGQRLGIGTDLHGGLAGRSLLAIARGDWESAQRFVGQARADAQERHVDDYLSTALVAAVAARVALHNGDATAATDELVRTQRLRPRLTYAFPWLSVLVQLELIHAYLAFADPAGARTVLREIETVLRHRPDLGVLVKRVGEVKEKLDGMHPAVAGMSALTSAELRVLPFLPSHLTFPEMGQRLVRSRHTIKSQAASIYRKLGVSTRGEAVARARELGLIE